MIFILLNIKYILDEKNFKEIKDNIKKIPSFGFFFSPYCPHCTKVHPIWENVSNLYENDTDVIAFECDTAHNGKLCNQLASFTGIPHFVKYIHKEAISINIERSFEGIQSVFKQLKTFDPSIKCRTYPLNFDQYPAIIYSTVKNPEYACDFLQKVKNRNPSLRHLLYYQKLNESIYPNTKSRLEVLFSENNSLVYNGSIGFSSISKFLRNYGMPFVEKWPDGFRSAKKISRRFVFIVYKGHWQLKRFKIFFEKYQKNIAVTQISFNDYNKCFNGSIDSSNLPALGFADKKKDHFFLLTNFEKTDVLPVYIDKYLNNSLEPSMQIPLKCLYQITKENVNNTRFIKEFVYYLGKTLCTLGFAFLIIYMILFVWNNLKMTPKVE